MKNDSPSFRIILLAGMLINFMLVLLFKFIVIQNTIIPFFILLLALLISIFGLGRVYAWPKDSSAPMLIAVTLFGWIYLKTTLANTWGRATELIALTAILIFVLFNWIIKYWTHE